MNNVLSEVDGKEVEFFYNGAASHSLEVILDMASEKQIKELMNKFSDNWVNLSCNRSSSHPVQIILKKLAFSLGKEGYTDTTSENTDPEHPQHYFEKICKEFSGDLVNLIYNTYGSFVLRNVLHICSGVVKLEDKNKRKTKRKWKYPRSKQPVPASMKNYLIDITKEIMGFK
eukprot:UN27681